MRKEKNKAKTMCCVLLNIMVIMTMLFSLTGCKSGENNQKKSENRLADHVEVGDYVNYDANSGLTTPITYNTNSDLTGYNGKSEFSSSDKVRWRVLSVDKGTGKVELIPEKSVGSVSFKGKTGFENAENVLNDIGAIYGHGKGATSGRSLNLDDVNNITGYVVNSPDINGEKNYSNADAKYPDKDKLPNGAKINGNSITVANKLNNYFYNVYSYKDKSKGAQLLYEIGEELYTKEYFLATRCIEIKQENDYCGFYLYKMNGDNKHMNYYESTRSISGEASLYWSSGREWERSGGVLPVVQLDNNCETTGKGEDGAWQLKFVA